jgi:multiple sugar transport system ATP-binding protein
MAKLSIRHLYKTYENRVEVLKDVNVEAADGEFVVLVGPSGCGKSTLLRSVAGLEDITSGEILIGDEVVNNKAPADRDIAMVFQDYALYPHMTVEENLAFGLKIRKRPEAEIKERVLEASRMLEIEPLLKRKPAQLSGGQRQRVAIGRAIVRKPSLFLFDEPLSNLDAKLRAQTRIELASLHQKVGSTVIYVTHDQVEAMTLANRIVVLNKGIVQQMGTPLELYNQPANVFVAAFIGNPSMNFFEGELDFSAGHPRFQLMTRSKETLVLDLKDAPVPKAPGRYRLGLRPEAIKVLTSSGGRESQGTVDFSAEVRLLEPHGHEAHLVAHVGGQQVIIRSANPQRLKVMEASRQGDLLRCTVDRAGLHWFAPDETGVRVADLGP